MEPQVPGTPEVPGQPCTQARERLSLTQPMNRLNKIVNKINNNFEKKPPNTVPSLCTWRVRFVTRVTLEAEERRAEPPVGWRRAAPPSADRGELSRQAAAQSGNSNRTQQQQQTHTNTLSHSYTHRHTHTRTHKYRRIIVLQGQRVRQCARDTHTHASIQQR